MWYVYLLQSKKDGKKYIGSSSDINRRVKQHNNGEVLSTRYRRPLFLMGYQEFNNVNDAVSFEKKYKRSHGALERAIRKREFKIIVDNGV